jgi:hypothetical protein
MIKLLWLSPAVLCALCAAGCNSDPRTVTGQPVDMSAAATSDQAKQAMKETTQNARIMQRIRQTGRLPNGEPLPSASNPGNMQPPGFHG